MPAPSPPASCGGREEPGDRSAWASFQRTSAAPLLRHRRFREGNARLPREPPPEPPHHGDHRATATFPGPPFGPGMIDWHAFWAAWNWGEEGSIPLGPLFLPPIRMPTPPPLRENSGSGKLGTPWGTMHCANRSAFSCNFACSAGLGGLPPLGDSFAQALLAAWNCADCGLTPVTCPLRS